MDTQFVFVISHFRAFVINRHDVEFLDIRCNAPEILGTLDAERGNEVICI